MFTSSVGRGLRSSCSARCPASPATAALRPLASRGSAVRRQAPQQRRHSSSNASIPPDGSRRLAPEQQAQKQASNTGRKGKRRSKANADRQTRQEIGEFTKQYPNLPVVRPTVWLKPEEAAISSFFAQHRPISVTNFLPEATKEADFNAIFHTPERFGKQRTDQVIFTLDNVIDELEGNGSIEDGPPETYHLDPPDHSDPESHLFAFQQPPPPPIPYADTTKDKAIAKPHGRRNRQKGKSWQTTIIVTEYHGTNGQRTFKATSTPIIRLPTGQQVEEPLPAPRMPQPFLERMKTREQRWRGGQYGRIRVPRKGVNMVLISVRRQRKLKMKKHKMKKLRKRTRNLRRKLGKL